jgi:hypothetical protein
MEIDAPIRPYENKYLVSPSMPAFLLYVHPYLVHPTLLCSAASGLNILPPVCIGSLPLDLVTGRSKALLLGMVGARVSWALVGLMVSRAAPTAFSTGLPPFKNLRGNPGCWR